MRSACISNQFSKVLNAIIYILCTQAQEFHDEWESVFPFMPYSATIHRIVVHAVEMMRLLPETLSLFMMSEVMYTGPTYSIHPSSFDSGFLLYSSPIFCQFRYRNWNRFDTLLRTHD